MSIHGDDASFINNRSIGPTTIGIGIGTEARKSQDAEVQTRGRQGGRKSPSALKKGTKHLKKLSNSPSTKLTSKIGAISINQPGRI